MKIKRYTASSMRAALALVRDEQGPDAVILSSRRCEEGIEVIAAIDYDEALFAETKRQMQAAQAEARADLASKAAAAAVPAATAEAPKAPVPAAIRAKAAQQPKSGEVQKPAPSAPKPMAATPEAPVPKQASPAAPTKAPAPAAPVASRSKPDFSITLMQREMREMRRMLETGMAGMTWHDKRLREPLKTQVLEQLSALDLEPDVVSAIAAATPAQTNLKDPGNMPLAMLIKHLSFIDDTTFAKGGVTALIGPTGAGKTTTIAKIAARWCLMYGNRDIALVSTDGYRIGAREQLMTYARILDVPMHTANSGKQLGILLERLSDKKLVLIDTAGMGPRDKRLREQIAALKLGAAQAKVILTLPAMAESQALEDIVRAFAQALPESCIITKIDEASTLGGVLSTAIRHKLKLAYVCDGQKVPDDLHAAQQRRVWLAKLAQQMKQGAAPRDTAYLAQHFAKVPAHA